MADQNEEIVIDGNTAVWDMRLEGAISGTYAGTFRFRCFLTPTQKIAANREMRELLGAHMTMAAEHEANLAFALTQLKYRILTAPPFWGTNGVLQGDIPDTEIILQILNTAIAAELKYMDIIKQKKLAAVEKAKRAADKMLEEQRANDLEDEKDDSKDDQS